jgi:predicted RecA/RadA family phage recombinase
MATATFVQDGNSIDYTPTVDVAAGDVVVLNDLVGIAKLDIAAHTLGALALVGVFSVPKVVGAGTGLAMGVKAYWNSTAVKATATASGNATLGTVVRAAADGESTVLVRLGA